MTASVLVEYSIPRTPVELYRLLKQCEKRNPITREVATAVEGGLGEFQEAQMRAWLKENRGASIDRFVDWIALMADRWNHDHTRPFCKVGEIAEGTLRRVINIMNGREQYYGQRQRPDDWDDEIDGTFNARQTATAPGSSMLNAKSPVQGVQTTSAPGTQTEGPGDRSATGRIEQVLTPAASEKAVNNPDLGPKEMTPTAPQGANTPPASEQRHAPYRGPAQPKK